LRLRHHRCGDCHHYSQKNQNFLFHILFDHTAPRIIHGRGLFANLCARATFCERSGARINAITRNSVSLRLLTVILNFLPVSEWARFTAHYRLPRGLCR
jgi:hypothetical protein